MSLAIDVDEVSAVLLADGWHNVANQSFTIDAYEFLWWSDAAKQDRDPMILHGGGRSGVCASGFEFETASGHRIAGPLTAILAVQMQADESGERAA